MATSTRSSVFFRDQKWNRLRVLGYTDRRKSLTEAKLTFAPLHQRIPAYGPNEPDYNEYMSQFIGDHNTISDLCELRNPWFICNMLQVAPAALGSRIKYLLRCSRDSFSGLLIEAQSAPDLYYASEEERNQQIKLHRHRFIILDIQAYDEQIALAGVTVGNPAYWPAGHRVWETKYNDERFGEYSLWEADDILLPANIRDEQLGKYILREWLARMKPPYPPPPELEELWHRIAD